MALTAARTLDLAAAQDRISVPVLAGVVIYQHAFVGKNPGGYAKPFVPGDEFLGLAESTVNAASDASSGLHEVEVHTVKDFDHTLASAAAADVGKPVYATDDGTLALTGHPDAYVGRILRYVTTNTVTVRLKRPGEMPPNGVGSVVLNLTGHEAFTATGATAGTSPVGAFDAKSILGLGWTMTDAEDGGLTGTFDATAEVALASLRTRNDCLPVDKGITFEADICVSDKGDAAALDIDFGLGTALTTNSEADIDHADMAQLACFHLDGNSDDVYAQSDDATTDVAAVDTTVNNDSTTDTFKRYKIVVRPTGTVEFWVDGARKLSSTAFALLSTALVGAFVNMEKTSDDTTAVIQVRNLRVAGGMAA